MNPRLLEISRTRHNWHNATNNVISTPLRFFYPEDAEDIREIVLEAEHEKVRVRAVGSGHSYSEVALCKDFLLDMKKIHGVEKYEAPWVKASVPSGKHFVRVGAGLTLKRLNLRLEEMKLALENMGAVDFQTVSGAVLTGTHGTGIKKPAFPDMVRSLNMVGKNGELLQIEPTDGITDPIYHSQNSNVTLIQDDDTFYSCVLGFGAMGIVYELMLEVIDRFWISEIRYLKLWEDFKAEIASGDFDQKLNSTDYMAFRMNPYKLKHKGREGNLCSIVEHEVVNTPPGGLAYGGRNLLTAIFGDMESGIENIIRSFNRGPEKMPKNIQRILRWSRVKKNVNKSYKILYQSSNSILRFGISAEFAFAYSKEKLIEVMEMIIANTEDMKAEADLYHPSHIPCRFVDASNMYLSQAYGKKVMYIDIPTLWGTTGDVELLERYQKLMISLGGVPHWGKVNNLLYEKQSYIEANYPKAEAWRTVRRNMDPDGTFLNDFVIKMGLE
jgi:FAD/FMN-containing dehydrogenase